MVFNHFRVNVLLRVLVLGASLLLFSYLLVGTSLYATTVVVGLAIVYQIFALIRKVEKTNLDLERFLLSVKHSDFSQTFSSSLKGRSFDKLNAAFSEVMKRFREIRLEGEENYHYLQTVVQHAGIGMIAYRENGEVELVNTAARRLFSLSSLKRIDDLEAISPTLVQRFRGIEPGMRDLVTVLCNDELLQLSIHATELKLRHDRITLVSLQNISSELSEKEMEAWQNLIRVLTHEIRNSLTPIASLAATVDDMLDTTGEEALLAAESAEEAHQALETIQKRSRGLLQFVDSYRDLTHLPRPRFDVFPAAELLSRVENLILPQATERGIDYQSSVDPVSLELTADPQLVEQALINLSLNAIEALDRRSGARIGVEARMDARGRVIISVSDNGPGIAAEAMDKLFVPFFTTKKGGSGIGLSLSRQIMRLHRGDLTARSVPNERTTFTLRF